MKIQAVIYDLDDLMVDSDPIHYRAWQVLFERHGLRFELPPGLHEQLIGRRIVDILAILIEELELDVDFDAFFAEREEIFVELVRRDLEALPGLVDSLEACGELGLPRAIASSGTRRYVESVVERFDLHDHFRAIITGDDVSQGKPHPEIYQLAARRLEVPPEHCLVLEDAQKGIEAALGAGCACWAVEAGNTPPQDRSRAHAILATLKEVRPRLRETLGAR